LVVMVWTQSRRMWGILRGIGGLEKDFFSITTIGKSDGKNLERSTHAPKPLRFLFPHQGAGL